MFTFGFYNSLNGDRKYNAEQISSIFDGIIEDGVYANVGEQFATVPGTGMQVIVKTGRAWFKHTWNLNDSWMTLNIDESDPIRSRIDSVVLEVNSNQEVRSNTIKILKGTVATYPVAPTMQHVDGIDQYRLADITIGPGVSGIISANIAIKVGQGETPFVTAPLKAADISSLFSQWNAQWDTELASWQNEFEEWFSNLKQQLTDDVVTNLQKQIDERVKMADKATNTNINNGTSNKWVDAAGLKTKLDSTADITYGLKIGDIVYSTRDLEKETSGKMIACDQRELLVSQYPELCATDRIKGRIKPFEKAVYTYPETDASVAYLNGSIYNNYVYNVTASSATIKVLRRELDFMSMAQYETIVTIAAGVSTNRSVYFANNKCYIFSNCHNNSNTSYNTWYIVDLVAKTYTTVNDTTVLSNLKTTSIDVTILGYHKISDSVICIYGGGSRDFSRDRQIAYTVIKYDITNKTRKVIINYGPDSSNTVAFGGQTACAYLYDMKGMNVYNNIVYFVAMTCTSTTSGQYSAYRMVLYSINMSSETVAYQYISIPPLTSLGTVNYTYFIIGALGLICNDSYIFIYVPHFGYNYGSPPISGYGTQWTQFYTILNYSGSVIKTVEFQTEIAYKPFLSNRSNIPLVRGYVSENRDYIISNFEVNGSENLAKLSLNSNLTLVLENVSSTTTHYMSKDNPMLAVYEDGNNTKYIDILPVYDANNNKLLNSIKPMYCTSLHGPFLVTDNACCSIYIQLYDYEVGFTEHYGTYGTYSGIKRTNFNTVTLVTDDDGVYVAGAFSIELLQAPATYDTYMLVANDYLLWMYGNSQLYITDLNYRIAPYIPNAYIKAKN